jgi:hypothetical protein
MPTLAQSAARRWGTRLCAGLFRFVCFEKSSCFFQVDDVSVHGQLIYACVFRDGDDALNTMAPFSEGGNEKIDIYHADEFTGIRFG